MSGTKIIVKEKTEKYKEQVVKLEHAQSNEIITEETIVLLNGDIEISVSFTFNLFYTGEDLKWDTPQGCHFKSLPIPRH